MFYRLGLRDCQSRDQSRDLYGSQSELGTILFKEGFFDPRRQAETSTEKGMQAMRDVTKFTGNEYDKDGCCGNGDPEARMRRYNVLDKMAEGVETVVRRLDGGRGQRGVIRDRRSQLVSYGKSCSKRETTLVVEDFARRRVTGPKEAGVERWRTYRGKTTTHKDLWMSRTHPLGRARTRMTSSNGVCITVMAVRRQLHELTFNY